MNDDQLHLRASEVFEAICDLAADEASLMAAELCAADEELLAEVLSLLSFDEPTVGQCSLLQADHLDRLAEEPLPERIGDFVIERLLGQGGMGRVYLARQQQPNRLVALKVLPPGWSSPAELAMLRQEAETLGGLQHPAVAHVHSAGMTSADDDGRPYFVMEYVDGLTLDSWVRKRSPSREQRIRLVIAICAGIAHAHQRGIIHRDIKPANILVLPSGAPKVLDFGVAVRTLKGNEGEGADRPLAFGTPSYMSPEQFIGEARDIDTRVDVYALGVVLFELLAGEKPWRAGPPLPLPDGTLPAPPDLARSNSSLRGDLAAIAVRALAVRREERYASVTDLADDLQRHLDHYPVLAHAGGFLYRNARFVRRHRLAVSLGVALLLAALGWVVREQVQLERVRKSETNLQVANSALRTLTGELSETNEALQASVMREQGATLRAVDAEQEALGRLAESHVRAADLAAQRGDWALVRSELEQAMELGGGLDVDVLKLRQVRALIFLGKRSQAQGILDGLHTEALDEAPRSEALLLSGLLEMAETVTWEHGREALEEAIDGQLDSADEFYAMGMIASTAPLSHRLFSAALEVDPFHHLSWHAKMQACLLSGRWRETLAMSETVSHLFPDDRAPIFFTAAAAILLGEEERAIEPSRLIEATIGRPGLHQLELLRDIHDAMANMISVTPWVTASMGAATKETIRFSGILMSLMGRLEASMQDPPALGALSGDSSPMPAFFRASGSAVLEAVPVMWVARDSASRTLERAARINPSFIVEFLRSSMLTTRFDMDSVDWIAAEKAWSKTLEYEPTTPAHVMVAELELLQARFRLRRQGEHDPTLAARIQESLDRLEPRQDLNEVGLRLLRDAAVSIGAHERAVALSRRWLDTYPDDLKALAHLAASELKAGFLIAARKHALQVLDRNPGDTNGVRILQDATVRLEQQQSAGHDPVEAAGEQDG